MLVPWGFHCTPRFVTGRQLPRKPHYPNHDPLGTRRDSGGATADQDELVPERGLRCGTLPEKDRKTRTTGCRLRINLLINFVCYVKHTNRFAV